MARIMTTKSPFSVVLYSIEISLLAKEPKPKNRPKLKKSENFTFVTRLPDGNKVFPNSQHDKLADVSRRLLEIIIFSLLVGRKSQKPVLSLLYGGKHFLQYSKAIETHFLASGSDRA